jgi:hypothetical protein
MGNLVQNSALPNSLKSDNLQSDFNLLLQGLFQDAVSQFHDISAKLAEFTAKLSEVKEISTEVLFAKQKEPVNSPILIFTEEGPNVTIGTPIVKKGPSIVKTGPPVLQIGPPKMKIAPPILQIGPAKVKIGPPFLKKGPPFFKKGAPILQIGPAKIKIGPPILKKGPPILQKGVPNLKFKWGFFHNSLLIKILQLNRTVEFQGTRQLCSSIYMRGSVNGHLLMACLQHASQDKLTKLLTKVLKSQKL